MREEKKAKGRRSRHASHVHAEYTSNVITCGSLRTKIACVE